MKRITSSHFISMLLCILHDKLHSLSLSINKGRTRRRDSSVHVDRTVHSVHVLILMTMSLYRVRPVEKGKGNEVNLTIQWNARCTRGRFYHKERERILVSLYQFRVLALSLLLCILVLHTRHSIDWIDWPASFLIFFFLCLYFLCTGTDHAGE